MKELMKGKTFGHNRMKYSEKTTAAEKPDDTTIEEIKQQYWQMERDNGTGSQSTSKNDHSKIIKGNSTNDSMKKAWIKILQQDAKETKHFWRKL